jgi:hypothetical protein
MLLLLEDCKRPQDVCEILQHNKRATHMLADEGTMQLACLMLQRE